MIQKSIVRVFLITLATLLIPMVGMQVGSGFEWDATDFIVMGGLIFVAGMIFELAMHKIKTKKQRIIAGALVVLAFIYIWAELAVGIFTNWGS